MDVAKLKQMTSNVEISAQDLKYVVDALKKKDISFAYGYTNKLETAISNFLGCKYVVAHCNGTSALYSAVKALDLNQEDEIICPSYTWWSSAAPVVNLGYKLVFCEIDEKLTVDFEDVLRKLNKKTKAIIVPHLWGNMCNVSALKRALRVSGFKKIFIIEDASHVFGGKYKNKFLGTLGDIGAFSLQKNKFLTAGEGGLLVTNDKKLFFNSLPLGHYERIRKKLPLNHKLLKFGNTGMGFKFRISPLSAALAFSQLQKIKKKKKLQNERMDYLRKFVVSLPGMRLSQEDIFGYSRGGIYSLRVYMNYRFSVKDLADLKNNFFIHKEGIPLLHTEPFFRGAKFFGVGALPQTEKIYSRLYSLPVFYRGNKRDLKSYVKELEEFLKGKKRI